MSHPTNTIIDEMWEEMREEREQKLHINQQSYLAEQLRKDFPELDNVFEKAEKITLRQYSYLLALHSKKSPELRIKVKEILGI